MLCQNCGKHEATTHIKSVVNGEYTQLHLCTGCAGKLGYGDVFSGFGFDLGDFFGNFFSKPKTMITSAKTERCEKCGMSFEEIVKNGKIGCAGCYEKFYEMLLPSVQRIHGKTQHNGKTANAIEEKESVKEKTKEEIIAELQAEMKTAIEEQNFERAAEIRDEIKAKEAE
ncbi:MAG: UvrB/UvrC motif-containing protein [Clostridia bacterium]|nr:UvrB/UvrC motif-containing protein [Clostridia bacterium]